MIKTRLATAAVLAISLLAACGSADDAAGDGVASLGSTTTAPGGADQQSETSLDPQEAMLAYTQCMRDEGIDMPDPEFSADGGAIAISSAADDDGGKSPAVDFNSEEFQAAEETCGHIMDDAVGAVEIDPERQAEMREQMLAYAECMREQGIDFPDPEFSTDGGMVTMGVGNPDGGPLSDTEQDAMAAANEACAQEGGPIMAGPAPTGEEG